MVQQLNAVVGQRGRLTAYESVLSLPLSGLTLVNDGVVVVRTTDGKSVKAVSAATPTRFGVVVRHGVGKTGKDTAGKEAYKAGDMLPVMFSGAIWVKPTAPVTDITAAVYVKTANGTESAPLGSLSSVATDGTALPGAVWETLTGADGLALINLRGA
ncbi:hypothetical protein F896_01182 [Acinetobacter genomosp. 15BJ]|uniref:Uncharacterized protein n=1 Tax=Acinetobacter genomosp. 15BJ TaxID=106651 RepID=R9B8D9_9GAMM|nr:hypothetical protein [Acinetobacter genomosp. 15BJ]EOR08656.1 hypothetical protein F896_01182 [Acinetobacter genomosp. 15BJ]